VVWWYRELKKGLMNVITDNEWELRQNNDLCIIICLNMLIGKNIYVTIFFWSIDM